MKTLTRRHVIAQIGGAGLVLCPAVLNAQTIALSWPDGTDDETPVGQARTVEISGAGETVDVSDLMPGEVAVLSMPSDDPTWSGTNGIRYVAVHRRTEGQIASAEANARDGDTQNPAWFVAELVCPHRGAAIGITDDPDVPFACTRRSSRHGGNFDASGLGIAGGAEGDYMSVPGYDLTIDGDTVTVTLT
ncbi:MAG: hypothetical protein ACU0CI_00135 [Shimia sp.]